MQIKLKKQHRRYSNYKNTGLPWLGEVPESWEMKKMKFSAVICNGKEYKDIESEDGQYPVFGSGGEFARATAYIYDKPSVLLGRKGTINKPLYVDEPFWTVDTMFFTKIFQKTFPKFFYYQCLNIDFDKYQYGSALPSMTQGTLSNIHFPTPKLEEQEEIADYLDEKTALLDRTIEAKQKQIELLKEKRTSLINQAVTRGIDENAEMRESGVEWIGEVPKNWIVASMIKFCESRVDYRGKTPEKVEEGVFLVTAKNIKDGKIDYELSQEYVREEDFFEIMRRGLPKKGDLLFTTEAPLGEVALVDRENIALAQRIIKFRSIQKKLNSFYFRYWAMSFFFNQHLQSYATGSTALGIKASKLHKLRIFLPPLEEQEKIVAFLDSETQKIDQTITLIEKSITLLEEYKTSLISNVVTGKINVMTS
jgi:type I restriction enzyme S subunit